MYFYISLLLVFIVLVIIFNKIRLYHQGGEKQMIAMLMAVNIVAGHYEWSRVPRLLKDQVREQLELMGVPELAGE